MADRPFGGGNAGSVETSPSSVRNPDFRINGRDMVSPSFGQTCRINTSPETNFPRRLCAVVGRATAGVKFAVFESTDYDFFLDCNARDGKTFHSPLGKAAGENF